MYKDDYEGHGPHASYVNDSTWWSQTAKTVLRKYIAFAKLEIERKGPGAKRVIIVRPMGQLCNRLMSITSAFVFGLLTRRALLIDDSGFYASMDDLFERPGFNWILNDETSYGIEDGTTLTNPDYGDWEQTSPLLCSNYEKVYKTSAVTIAMNQYIVPYMARNHNYQADLKALFGDDLFFAVSRFLYRPIDKLRKELDVFLQSQRFGAQYVVGLQVRSGPDFTSNFMRDHAWGLYKDCGIASTPPSQRKNLKYFVATDTEEGREMAIKYLGKENVMFGPTEFLRSNHPRGVQMALLDLLILSECRDRVTTAWSSYGYFAAGYAGVAPNMVTDTPNSGEKPTAPGDILFMGISHKSDRRTQCARLKNSQPCFHKFAVWGAFRTPCANKAQWEEEEMSGGRYC
jgi:hypothetical protein